MGTNPGPTSPFHTSCFLWLSQYGCFGYNPHKYTHTVTVHPVAGEAGRHPVSPTGQRETPRVSCDVGADALGSSRGRYPSGTACSARRPYGLVGLLPSGTDASVLQIFSHTWYISIEIPSLNNIHIIFRPRMGHNFCICCCLRAAIRIECRFLFHVVRRREVLSGRLDHSMEGATRPVCCICF